MKKIKPTFLNWVFDFLFFFFGSLHQHLAVRHTSVKLVGELADWVNHHPEHLAHILNWLLISLREPKIASQAAEALLNICSQCQNHMTPHFQGIVHILSSLGIFVFFHLFWRKNIHLSFCRFISIEAQRSYWVNQRCGIADK